MIDTQESSDLAMDVLAEANQVVAFDPRPSEVFIGDEEGDLHREAIRQLRPAKFGERINFDRDYIHKGYRVYYSTK